MLRSVSRRLTSDVHKITPLRWSKRRFGKVLAQWVGVTDAAGRSGDPPDVEMEGSVQKDLEEVIPSEGISFRIPSGRWLSPVIKSTLRKVHCNLGHPSKEDLKRFLKTGGAHLELVEAAEWIECSVCAQSKRPRIHRRHHIPPHDLQFNDEVLVDCFQTKDIRNTGHWFLSVLDRATMYHTACLVENHSPGCLLQALKNCWQNAFGAPRELVIDQERGFIGPEFVDDLQMSCAIVTSIAGQAHWQHGKIERHNGVLKDMLKRTVTGAQVSGPEDMNMMVKECVSAKNSLVREHGFSPQQLVFGRDVQREGEIYANGEAVSYHFQVGERGSRIAQLMKFRYESQKAFVEAQSKSILERTVENRTRPWKEPKIGDLCFFYRENRKTKQQGLSSGWVGPAYVVGLQGNSSVWVTMGGRCYLVAHEHCREAIGEEQLFGRPQIQEALTIFKNGRKGMTYLDLTDQEAPPDEMLNQAALDVDEMSDGEDIENVPLFHDDASVDEYHKQLSEWARQSGWCFDDHGNPVQVSYNAWSYRTPYGKFEGEKYPHRSSWVWRQDGWHLFEDKINWRNLSDPHEFIPGGRAAVLVTVFHHRIRTQQQAFCEDSVPISIKRLRQDQMVCATVPGKAGKKQLKALDKEIPLGRIPREHIHLFEEAKQKEWDSWLKYDTVKIFNATESQKVRKEQPERLLGSRFVYRDKHAGMVKDGKPLGIKAKARLVIGGQNCPDTLGGLVQVDAPTIQRTSFYLFLHCVVSYGWLDFWRNGDVSNAFLQGECFDFSKRKPTYMKPPREGIPGVSENQLLMLKKPVYGLPEAPKAWYATLRSALEGLGFQVSVIDPALFIHRNVHGLVNAMVTTHVDDLMLATDGTPEIEATVVQLQNMFPFGEWEEVAKVGKVTYCGKQIKIDYEHGERVIKVNQNDFCQGRLSKIDIDKTRAKEVDATVTEQEKSDFRSTLGCLQWLSTQTRVDICFDTNQLQKRINDLRVKDLLMANQLVREAKRASVDLVFRNLGRDTAVVVFHDAGLYSSVGVEIDDQEDEHVGKLSDKYKLYSQKGAVVGIVKRDDLNKIGPSKCNFIDWKSKTSG